MKIFLTLAPIVFLAACGGGVSTTQPPTSPALPPAANDTCNANRYAGLIGQDATALERVLLLGQVRVIRPGQAVTMDFRPERINFNVGLDNRITSIQCS